MPDTAGPVLGFDTSAAHCAAAVVSGDRVLALRFEPMAKGQAERLMGVIQDTLAAAGVGFADLAGIGVGVGPGNFTGIRVSVAAARGLALSLGVPAVGVTVTEAAALDAPRPTRAIVAARGDEVFWQDFDATGPVGAPGQAVPDDLPPGPPVHAATVPAAVAIARIASARIISARIAGGTPIPRPAPLYLRPADAAPPRDPAPVLLP